MKCVICKTGTTVPGTTTITFESGETTVVFRSVPAEVCSNCGEAYVDEPTSRRLLEFAQNAAQNGIQTETRQYQEAI